MGTEDCFKGEEPGDDPKERDEKKKPVKIKIKGDREPSQYSPSKESKIDDQPVTLRLDLGGNVWIIGAIEKDILTMIKIRFTKADVFSVMAKRRNDEFDKACALQKTFTEDCFKGEEPGDDPKEKDEKKKPVKIKIKGDREPSQYSPSKESKIDDQPVTLRLDLGGNV